MTIFEMGSNQDYKISKSENIFYMLQSLERQTGLPLAFNPITDSLHLADGIICDIVSVRTAAQMTEYIGESGVMASDGTIYSVWRNIARQEDEARLRLSHLRYDITVLKTGHFTGQKKEFFRTAGHYHPVKPGTGIAYPEVFEVISGRACWLLQRPAANDNGNIDEIYAVEAGPGEKAVILPGFGHISINAGAEPLIMANWVGDTFQYDYDPWRKFRGGGWRAVERPGGNGMEFTKNGNYSRVPELKKLRPKEVPEFGLVKSRPLYSLAAEIKKLDFLNSPENFMHILTLDHCYRPVV